MTLFYAILVLCYPLVVMAQTPPWSPARTWGLVCNGTADDTVALQAAVTASRSTLEGKPLSLPPGCLCKLSGSIVIENVRGLVIDGQDTKLTWGGAADVPMILVRDAQGLVLRNFRVSTSASTPVLNVLQVENGAGTTLAPTHNGFEHIEIECTNGGCTNGVVIEQGAGGDSNNEFNWFRHVAISNIASGGAAFLIKHGQSKHNVLEDVSWNNTSGGAYGVSVNPRGSFHCIRCRGGHSTVSDFYINDATDPILISQGNFESSARLLTTGGPSAGASVVTIQATRWAMNSLHADNRIISYQFRGALNVVGNFFEPATANRALEIYYNPGGGIGSLVAIGNTMASTLTNPFTGTQPTISQGNLIDRNDGNNPVPLDPAVRLGQAWTAATLPTNATNGTLLYCADCTIASPCAGSGTGALAKRLNGSWVCN